MGTENKIIGKIWKTEQEILSKIKEISEKLNVEYNDEDEVVVISVSKGGNNLTYDLIKKLNFDLSLDFISADSYYKEKKLSSPKVNFDSKINLENKRIIIIDDYVDTGETMIKITNLIKTKKVKDILVIGLFGNPNRINNNDVKEIFGWDEHINGFLVGYGLDYDEKYRNIPYVAIIKGTEC